MNNTAATVGPLSAISESAKATRRAVLSGSMFCHRGLSDRTIEALVEGGVDFPERLLSMTEAEVKAIRGIDQASFAEIVRYQSRFAGR